MDNLSVALSVTHSCLCRCALASALSQLTTKRFLADTADVLRESDMDISREESASPPSDPHAKKNEFAAKSRDKLYLSVASRCWFFGRAPCTIQAVVLRARDDTYVFHQTRAHIVQ